MRRFSIADCPSHSHIPSPHDIRWRDELECTMYFSDSSSLGRFSERLDLGSFLVRINNKVYRARPIGRQTTAGGYGSGKVYVWAEKAFGICNSCNASLARISTCSICKVMQVSTPNISTARENANDLTGRDIRASVIPWRLYCTMSKQYSRCHYWPTKARII